MKIAAYHKAHGDNVEWYLPNTPCDLLYCSKIFTNELTSNPSYTEADAVIKGGTGYDVTNKLDFDIEHIYPDYSIYPNCKKLKDTAVGFLTRGCPNNCDFCIVSQKEGCRSQHVADVTEFWRNQRNVTLFDPNILACADRERLFAQLKATNAIINFEQGLDARLINADTIALLKTIKTKVLYFAWDLEKNEAAIKRGLLFVKKQLEKSYRDLRVYVLVNFNTEWQYDIERVNWLKANGFDPYVMIYEKWAAADKYHQLQGAVNNKILFRDLATLAEFKPLKPYLQQQ
jgi:hypothetical protein